MKLVVASRNRDKIREILEILKNRLPNTQVYSLLDFPGLPDIEEDGLTLYENALKKALKTFEFTGLPSIADDTGLCVDYLNGMPGVYSARFAGPNATYDDNVRKLLNLLDEVEFTKRRARFITVAVFYDGRRILRYDGEVIGFISRKPRGSGGFGYDPIFLYPPLGRTFAELPLQLKNRVSHRFKAIKGLAELILAYEGGNTG